MRPNLLTIGNMSKSFKEKIVFNDVNISFREGEIILIYGPNGAGKSVFLNILLGFQEVDKGSIKLDGVDIDNIIELRRKSAIVSADHQSFLFLLTPKEYFSFIMDLYNLGNKSRQKIKKMCRELNVFDELNSNIETLSFGTRKKIQLIGALAIDPLLLLCDELFEGVDHKSNGKIIEYLQDRKQGKKLTIITTHIKEYGEILSTKSYKIRGYNLVENERNNEV